MDNMTCAVCAEPIEENWQAPGVRETYGLAEYVHLVEHEDTGDTHDADHNAKPAA